VVWPQGTLGAAVHAGQASETFTVVCVCFLLVLLYLGARFGSDDLSEDAGAKLHEYVRLTPASVARLVGARFTAGAAHTALLVLLGAPLLAASLSVGGATPPQMLACLLVLGMAGMVARMWGLLALSVAGTRRSPRGFIAYTGISASALTTFYLAPSVSPFHVLAGLPRATGVSAAWPCIAACAGAAVTLAAGSAGALAVRRVRARRHSRKGS